MLHSAKGLDGQFLSNTKASPSWLGSHREEGAGGWGVPAAKVPVDRAVQGLC